MITREGKGTRRVLSRQEREQEAQWQQDDPQDDQQGGQQHTWLLWAVMALLFGLLVVGLMVMASS